MGLSSTFTPSGQGQGGQANGSGAGGSVSPGSSGGSGGSGSNPYTPILPTMPIQPKPMPDFRSDSMIDIELAERRAMREEQRAAEARQRERRAEENRADQKRRDTPEWDYYRTWANQYYNSNDPWRNDRIAARNTAEGKRRDSQDYELPLLPALPAFGGSGTTYPGSDASWDNYNDYMSGSGMIPNQYDVSADNRADQKRRDSQDYDLPLVPVPAGGLNDGFSGGGYGGGGFDGSYGNDALGRSPLDAFDRFGGQGGYGGQNVIQGGGGGGRGNGRGGGSGRGGRGNGGGGRGNGRGGGRGNGGGGAGGGPGDLGHMLRGLLRVGEGQIWEMPRSLQATLQSLGLSQHFNDLLRGYGMGALGDFGEYGFPTDWVIPGGFDGSAFLSQLQQLLGANLFITPAPPPVALPPAVPPVVTPGGDGLPPPVPGDVPPPPTPDYPYELWDRPGAGGGDMDWARRARRARRRGRIDDPRQPINPPPMIPNY